MNDFNAVVSSSEEYIEKFSHDAFFYVYQHLILIISYTMCVIIVCLRKLQDVVEAIHTIFFEFLIKNKNQEHLWNEGISNNKYNEKFNKYNRFYFFTFFLFSRVRDTRLLPTDTRDSEIVMKNITQRIS